MLNLKIYSFAKKEKIMKEILASNYGSLGTAQTVRWPCIPITLLIGHFESPTEVQLNSC